MRSENGASCCSVPTDTKEEVVIQVNGDNVVGASDVQFDQKGSSAMHPCERCVPLSKETW